MNNHLKSIFSYNRDWRYHVEEKIWVMRVPGHTNYEKNGSIERGTYYYFDATNWRRVPKEFQIDTKKLDTPVAIS
jgi:CCR4-NOT transcription complex subunit 2